MNLRAAYAILDILIERGDSLAIHNLMNAMDFSNDKDSASLSELMFEHFNHIKDTEELGNEEDYQDEEGNLKYIQKSSKKVEQYIFGDFTEATTRLNSDLTNLGMFEYPEEIESLNFKPELFEVDDDIKNEWQRARDFLMAAFNNDSEADYIKAQEIVQSLRVNLVETLGETVPTLIASYSVKGGVNHGEAMSVILYLENSKPVVNKDVSKLHAKLAEKFNKADLKLDSESFNADLLPAKTSSYKLENVERRDLFQFEIERETELEVMMGGAVL